LNSPAATAAGRLFFAAAALFTLLLVVLDARVTAQLLERVAAIATLDAGQLGTPVAPGARARSGALLPGAFDAKWYAIHAESLLRGEGWRIRSTNLDNAPHGREVHWASLLVWALAGWASLLSWFSVRPAVEEVQLAALSFGPVSFVAVAAAFAFLVWRRFGPVPAGAALILLSGSFPVYDAFRSGEVDHHGIAAFFCMVCVFGLAAGGGGFAPRGKPPRRGWFVVAGMAGGLGLWVSASTTLPVIAACGLGGLLAVFCIPRTEKKAEATPKVWWQWAVIGAATALLCYFVEYFPGGFAWRLEVNHPLYALAWLGGGWLLASACAWLARRRGCAVALWPPMRWSWVSRGVLLAAAVGLVSAPLVAVGLAGPLVFTVSDPFLLRLHTAYISEFAPLWIAIAAPDWPIKVLVFAWWPVLAAGLLVLFFRRRAFFSPLVLPPLVLATAAAAIAQAEALWQVRWSGLATVLWIVVLVVCLGSLVGPAAAALPSRRARRMLAALFLPGFVPVALVTLVAWLALSVGGEPQYPKSYAPSLLLRDIAHRLIRAQPDRVPVVLADPTSSTDLAFYGGLPVIGTLYWENNEGLRRAARILAATDADELRRGLAGAGIGFVVLPTWDGFADLTDYSPLLRAGGEKIAAGPPYLTEVIAGRARPDWLRPVHYPIPSAFGLEASAVHIYEFVPEQTPFGAHRARGLYEFERGEYAAAVREFEAALALQDDHEVAGWLPVLRQRAAVPRP